MNNNKENIKEIAKLVSLYMSYNPLMNRGIAYKAKTNDIISSYINIHKKSIKDIEQCIITNPECTKPIWIMFHEYFNKPNNNKYKDSVNNSLNPDDWV